MHIDRFWQFLVEILLKEYAIKWWFVIPPLLTNVSALPWESWTMKMGLFSHAQQWHCFGLLYLQHSSTNFDILYTIRYTIQYSMQIYIIKIRRPVCGQLVIGPHADRACRAQRGPGQRRPICREGPRCQSFKPKTRVANFWLVIIISRLTIFV